MTGFSVPVSCPRVCNCHDLILVPARFVYDNGPLNFRCAEPRPATTKEEMASNQTSRRERAKSNGPADDAGDSRPRVLAADDNSINRLLLARHLTALGMQPVMAEDGAEALAQWRDAPDGHYAMIITDCIMPEMDGYQLARALRTLEAKQSRVRTPMLAWTDNAAPDIVGKCREAGIDDLLAKPIDLCQLNAMIEKWLPRLPEAAIDSVAPKARRATPPTGQFEPAIDMQIFRETFGDNGETAQHLLNKVCSKLPPQIEALVACLDRNELPAIKHASHKLKGASGMIGATPLAAICDAIETAACNENAAAVSALRACFVIEAERTTAALAMLKSQQDK